MEKGDELLAKIVRGEKNIDSISNDLLEEFHHGYPIDRLAKLLLETEDEEVLKVGVWIASELGAKAAPYLDRIAALLAHSHPHVRFFAIDNVLASATQKDGRVVARVPSLLDDPDSGIRWKALDFLVQAPEPLLKAALDYVVTNEGESEHVQGLRLLTSGSHHIQQLGAAYVRSENRTLRRYGVAAAVRIAQENDRLLRQVLQLEDPELIEFAMDMAKRGELDLA